MEQVYNHPIWNYIPNIIAGCISIAAMMFAYFQTGRSIKASEKQLKIQLATTIEKEWLTKVREYVSILIYRAGIIRTFEPTEIDTGGYSDEEKKEAGKSLFEFKNGLISLTLMLDKNDKYESALFDKCILLSNTMDYVDYCDYDYNEMEILIKEVTVKAKELFANKTVSIKNPLPN